MIDGVMWKGVANAWPSARRTGVEVIATGKLTIYPGRSKYQIVIERMELAGAGALMRCWRSCARSSPARGCSTATASSPAVPARVIGVVTSPTGAVIRDILHRLEDRCPTRVIVWPVKVQGEGAAAEVAAAVRGFDALPADGPVPRPDLVIVARGGGSIEDLWAFQRGGGGPRVAACSIPIISAVGHETDTNCATMPPTCARRRRPPPPRSPCRCSPSCG